MPEEIILFLEEAWEFIVRYWTYLLTVALILIGILVAAFIMNTKTRYQEDSESDEEEEEEEIVPEPVKNEETTPEPVPTEPVLQPLPKESLEENKTVLPEQPVNPQPLQPSVNEIAKTVSEEVKTETVPKAEDQPVSNDEDSIASVIPENVNQPELTKSMDPEEPKKPEPKPKKPLGKYHVMYRADGKWIVKREGSQTIFRVLETQREAISWATIKALPQDIGIVVHQKDGKIRKNTPL